MTQLRALLTLVLTLSALLLTPEVGAAELQTTLSSRDVRVGETFTVQATISLSDEGSPRSPQLTLQGPAEASAPSVSTQRRISMHNFNVTQEKTVTATWTVVVTGPGQITVGPASFVVDGKRVSGDSVQLSVQPGPARTPAPPSGRSSGRSRFGSDPFGFDPFDPFGSLQGSGSARRSLPEAPEELQLSQAPHPIAFLRAITDAQQVVVGQPVRLSIYAYGSQGSFRELSPTEPSTADFLSFPVVETSHEETTYVTTIGDQEWRVIKLRELILVPLKTGELPIGEMTTLLQGRGYPTGGHAYGRSVKSEPLVIQVTEPPLAGRPDGYLLGDVGRFSLEVQLSPTELEVGEYAQVIVQIRGRGNLPSQVLLPEQAGVEWQLPTLSGGPQIKNRQLQGTRTLQFAVRFLEPGTISLGAVELPYFDPDSQTYRIAKKDLGSVQVRPSSRPATSAPTGDSTDPATNQADSSGGAPLTIRTSLSPYQAQVPFTQPSWTRWLLWLVPGVLGILRLLPLLFSRLTAPWARRTRSSSRSARQLLAPARQAAQEQDPARTARELDRALYELLEQEWHIRARALLRSELGTELTAQGVPEDLANQTEELACSLDAFRYDSTTATSEQLLELASRIFPALQQSSQRVRKKRANS